MPNNNNNKNFGSATCSPTPTKPKRCAKRVWLPANVARVPDTRATLTRARARLWQARTETVANKMSMPMGGMPGLAPGSMLQPQIVLLKEGTDTSQGKAQLVSNINACQAVMDTVRTTLGPRGMDKLMFDGKKVTISNDGATIMKQLDIAHPAAKTLVDISMSQDAEVGDGTTSVVLLAAEMLKQVKIFVEDEVHPQILIRGPIIGVVDRAVARGVRRSRSDAEDEERVREGPIHVRSVVGGPQNAEREGVPPRVRPHHRLDVCYRQHDVALVFQELARPHLAREAVLLRVLVGQRFEAALRWQFEPLRGRLTVGSPSARAWADVV